jgi:hypothetical protein
MGTISVWERGVSKWDFLSLPARFHMGISIWKWQSPCEKHSQGIFSSIPKWAQTLFGNRLVTEPVPIWKWGRVHPSSKYMRHAQPNGKIVKKIDFFDKKIGFFNRKISV